MSQILCKGTLLKLSMASVLTTIAQLTAIQPPGLKSTSYDSSSFDQSGNARAKDMDGWTEGNDFSASLWWDPALASHAAIAAAISTPVKTTWEVLFPGGKKIDWTSAGLELSPKCDQRTALQCDIKGEIDGLPVIT
jgi:hypothetical protein